jgi:glycosyltransferase involved in cell wall biosynthesis
VYLEPPWKMHVGHSRLVAHPPSGYEIVTARTAQERVFDAVTSSNVLRFLLRSSDAVLPTGLVKSALDGWNKPPAGTVLTYACDHLVFRREPWVVEVEFAGMLAGRHPKHLKRFGKVVTRALSSRHCRKIICWSEAGRRGLPADLNSTAFAEKIEVVPYAVPPRLGEKSYRATGAKLIFVSSDLLGSSWTAFEYKGGREVLAMFKSLRQQGADVELVMRASIPPDVRRRYLGQSGLHLIEHHLSPEDLDREYRAADICILPSHTTIPVALLEAMSYELPVVTIDSWANAEYVHDGRTGLVAPRSRRLPYYYPGTTQTNFGTAEFERAIRVTDTAVVGALAERVRRLVDQPELRRQLGRAGRYEVERGRFSLASVNDRLRRVFDEAVDGRSA